MIILVCYDANVLAEIEKEMQIIKVKLQHWTSRQEHVIIQGLYVWHVGMLVNGVSYALGLCTCLLMLCLHT